jgi:hypothetical protein
VKQQRLNDATCTWDVTGTQDPAPTTTACYETATFNDATCTWDVTGTQDPAPTTACYETATFNDTTCTWDVTWEHKIPYQQPRAMKQQRSTFNMYLDVQNGQDPAPTTACVMKQQRLTMQHVLGCNWKHKNQHQQQHVMKQQRSTMQHVLDVTGTQDPAPTTACYETATFNDAT